jgi:tRNA(Arg) A34 adenosine deaminase TadA
MPVVFTICLLLNGISQGIAATPDTPSSAQIQQEKDTVLSLACLSVVYKNWQTNSAPGARGHNIGCVLVDSNSFPVAWNVNCVTVLDNGTQHGEVRVVQEFLSSTNASGKYIDGYSVYTTLEPCAMCTGMMTMTKAKRCVYVQADPGYGSAIKGLNIVNYPRVFQSYTPTTLPQKVKLEQQFAGFMKTNPSITDYLLTTNAQAIYASALSDLNNYQVKNATNAAFYTAVTNFIATQVNTNNLHLDYTVEYR